MGKDNLEKSNDLLTVGYRVICSKQNTLQKESVAEAK